MEITKSFFLDRVWQRHGVYWKAFEVTNLCKNKDTAQYNATLECEQVFISQMDSVEHLRNMILNELLIELDHGDDIELGDGLYLNIVTEYKYPLINKKRFLVNISDKPNHNISEFEYINNVMDTYQWEQI